MSLEPGATLLHYRITEKLGEGGMGAVWRATDTSLDRQVAIKVLLPQVASQPDRLARFDREAKLLASLNHPNIAAVYGFHEHEGTRFVVMEMVEGEDLSQRIQRGPIAIEEALEIAACIAEALAAAHDRGVIHRDLKPANVRVTPDGTIKVLDFGLAKSFDPAGTSGDDPTASPTVTSGGTAFGVILGTAAYMSPEQARGKAVDRRTDLWAFGGVLYEMLTGRRAFGGETITDTLAEVIGKEPDWSLLPAATPSAVRRLLRRCFSKDAAQRIRDAADARLELFERDEPATTTTVATKRSPLSLVLAALFGAVAVGVVWFMSSTAPEPGLPDELPLLRQATFTGNVAEPNAIGGASVDSIAGLDLSSDGRTAVYLTRERDRAIMIDLDGGGSRTLYSATAGTSLYDAAWSPDGDRVYLMTWPYSERVFSVPRLGGEVRPEFDLSRLAGLNGIFARPLPDDRWLVYGNHNTLYVGDDPGLLGVQGTQIDGDGVFRIEGLDLLHNAVASPNGHIAFHGTDASGIHRSGVTDSTGRSGIVEGWSGLEPVSFSNGGSTLWLRRPAGPEVGDLLRVDVNSGGRPQGDPELIYPRLTGRSVQVGPNGNRVLVRSGDDVVNVSELTLDATLDAADNPARVLTRGTGRWKASDFLADGTLIATLVTDLRGELYAISPDGVQRSIVRTEGFASFGVAASRDGGRIAIAVDGPPAGILIHDRATNRSRTIVVPEPLSQIDWSPDDTTLVGMTKNSADHFVVVDVESGEARRVAIECGNKCEFAYEGIRTGPEWPYFAVSSEVDIWVLDAETGAVRQVAASTWNILDWQDDLIYFTRGPGQTEYAGHALFRVPAGGGEEERLLNMPLNCTNARVSPGGRTVACDMDESRLDLWVGDGLRVGGG